MQLMCCLDRISKQNKITGRSHHLISFQVKLSSAKLLMQRNKRKQKNELDKSTGKKASKSLKVSPVLGVGFFACFYQFQHQYHDASIKSKAEYLER